MFSHKRLNIHIGILASLVLIALILRVNLVKAAASIVTTVSVAGITDTTATFSGSHEGDGALTITERGFEYGTTIGYGSTVTEDGSLYQSSFGEVTLVQDDGKFISLGKIGNDAAGNIFTTDYGEDRIQKFNSSGTFISEYDVSWPAVGGLTTPTVVRGAPDGKLYAVDSTNNQILRFDDSNFTNPTVFSSGTFTAPNDIAFDSLSNVYVADFGAARILKLDPTGVILLTLSGGSITFAQSIAVDSGGNIFYFESSDPRIHKFNSSGVEIDSSVGFTDGTSDGQFLSSAYLSIDDEDNVYAADTGNHRIQKFDNDLNFVSKFGISGTSDGEFSSPGNIIFGDGGTFYVADSGNNRIQIFNERFTLSASGLSCGTDYHYRAFATNTDGTGNGADDTFTTDDCSPPPPSGGGGGGGGGGTHFICTDPEATNYTPPEENGKPNNDKCKYAPKLSCAVPLYLTKAVRYGAMNNPLDVKLLENFLNTYEGKNVPVDGFYSLTDRDIVIKWQEKYPAEILTPWGLKHGTGYVYLTSLRKIKQIHEAECARLGQNILGEHCYLFDRKLKRGDKSVFVKSAQKALQAAGNLSGIADGVFGKKTEQAVKDFQSGKGLKIDGIIGQGTGHELGTVKCDL